MGKLQDFSIVYDHESGVYKAGDTLKGQVYIRLADRMKMRSKCPQGARTFLPLLVTSFSQWLSHARSYSYVYVSDDDIWILHCIGVTLQCDGFAKVKWSYNTGDRKVSYRKQEHYIQAASLILGAGEGTYVHWAHARAHARCSPACFQATHTHTYAAQALTSRPLCHVLADVRLWCQGKGKVHWTKTQRGGKHSRVVHYHAQEVYFDTTCVIYGQGLIRHLTPYPNMT